MGGRGGSSRKGSGGGFSYKQGNKQMIVMKTPDGGTVINGQLRKNVNYDKLKKSAQNKEGYKTLTKRELRKKTSDRYRDYNSHDYEVGANGERGKRKTVYRPRRA